MSQGPLCPNLSQKVQKEVSQMANRNLSCAMLYRWFKCKLKPPNKHIYTVQIIILTDIESQRNLVFKALWTLHSLT